MADIRHPLPIGMFLIPAMFIDMLILLGKLSKMLLTNFDIVKLFGPFLDLFTGVVFFTSAPPDLKVRLVIGGFGLDILEAVLGCWRGWYDGR